jgi:GTP-binding protein HflX
VTGEGMDALLDAIDHRLGKTDEILSLKVPANEGRLINWLHENADVMETHADEDSGAISFRVRVASEKKQRLLGQLKKAGVEADA